MSTPASSQNVPCPSLTDGENEVVFTIIGNRRQSKATAVVQMFHAEPDRHQWSKFKTGVVCFVKDNVKKTYYVRLVDLATKSIVYEQEVYNQFTYNRDRPYFHSYPGDKFMVGLNFASEKEASQFANAVEAKLQERTERRMTIKRERHATPIGRPPVNVNAPDGGDPFAGINKTVKLRKPRGKIKLSKADIGAPSDFKHLAHVGFDPSTGNFDSSNVDPQWKKLLDTVGVSDEQLQDKSTATFIYDFVEKHGGIQEANRQLEEASRNKPPPPPSRATQRGQPKRGGRGLPPPPPRDSRGAAPPPPPSSGRFGGSSAAPPPPPPPPIGVPAPPPPPPVGSTSTGGPERKGGPPPPPSRDAKPPSSSSLPTVSNERGNLLASIRAGITLKARSEEDQTSPTGGDDDGLDGMAGALVRALAMRSNVIQQSDSESEEEWEDEDDEWGSED